MNKKTIKLLRAILLSDNPFIDYEGNTIPEEGMTFYPRGSDWNASGDYILKKLEKYDKWKAKNIDLFIK